MTRKLISRIGVSARDGISRVIRFIRIVNNLLAAGMTFIHRTEMVIAGFLKDRLLFFLETRSAKVMWGSSVAITRLVGIYLGSGAERNKAIAFCCLPPLFVLYLTSFACLYLILKVKILFMQRENRVLKLQYFHIEAADNEE